MKHRFKLHGTYPNSDYEDTWFVEADQMDEIIQRANEIAIINKLTNCWSERLGNE